MRYKTNMTRFYLILFFITSLYAQPDLEEQLAKDIADRRLNEFSHIEAAFILSGATTRDSLINYLNRFNNIVQQIDQFNWDIFDRYETAGKIFSYLHANWLITYKEEATTLIDVVHKKKYNCVAGTILYNLVCQELNIQTEAFETPTHTYTLLPNYSNRDIMVENTRPSGFDIMKNLRAQSEYLLQFYPDHQAAQIGLDRIYAYENSKGRKIDNTELLGLLAYNRAYFANRVNHFEKAFEFVLLAQKFNNDSRSNINFEKGLYYNWGKTLFDRRLYHEAYDVYVQAWQRYWEDGNFARNCIAAFYSALRVYWQKKQWMPSYDLIADMLALDLMKQEDKTDLLKLLRGWAHYHHQKKSDRNFRKTLDFIRQIDPEDTLLETF